MIFQFGSIKESIATVFTAYRSHILLPFSYYCFINNLTVHVQLLHSSFIMRMLNSLVWMPLLPPFSVTRGAENTSGIFFKSRGQFSQFFFASYRTINGLTRHFILRPWLSNKTTSGTKGRERNRCAGDLWVVGGGHTFPKSGSTPGMSPESACALQNASLAVPSAVNAPLWLVRVTRGP